MRLASAAATPQNWALSRHALRASDNMPFGIPKIDFLTRMRVREMALMGLITVTAVLANLPRDYVEQRLGIDPNLLLAVLGCMVIFGLFLYLKFFFFLAVVLLIAGANMPDQIADGLHISKLPLLLALVALVGLSLVNTAVKLLPTGLEPKGRQASAEAVRALFYAVEKGSPEYAQKVLELNFDPNLRHDSGYTALAYAAMKGSVPLIEVLLRHGADPRLATRDGDTPVEVALRFGHGEVADLLRRARRRVEPQAPDTTV
jgi:hypothetical protein